jgi:hypothetical protein
MKKSIQKNEKTITHHQQRIIKRTEYGTSKLRGASGQ